MTEQADIAKRRLFKRLGYPFSSLDLVDQALTHRSHGACNNERLEFLGESLLNFIIAQALYEQFPEASEGQLSRLRAQLVKGACLAEVSRELELGDCLRLGPGELKSGGYRRDSILADAVEALLAAVYLEGGMDSCRRSVVSLFDTRLAALSLQDTQKDAKSRLQEFLQARGEPLPEYAVLTVSGPAHAQRFKVSCRVSLLPEPMTGSAQSRRAAEQAAAQQVLDRLSGPEDTKKTEKQKGSK